MFEPFWLIDCLKKVLHVQSVEFKLNSQKYRMKCQLPGQWLKETLQTSVFSRKLNLQSLSKRWSLWGDTGCPWVKKKKSNLYGGKLMDHMNYLDCLSQQVEPKCSSIFFTGVLRVTGCNEHLNNMQEQVRVMLVTHILLIFLLLTLHTAQGAC